MKSLRCFELNMPTEYTEGVVFRITNHPVRGWEASFKITDAEASFCSTVDQDQIRAGLKAKLGQFFEGLKSLPADAEKMQRRFDAIAANGPDVVDVETSRQAAPSRKRWTDNLSTAYAVLLDAPDGLTDEEAGREFARRKQRSIVDIGNSWRPSRGALVKAGLVQDSGRTRELRSGNQGTVWVVTNRLWEPPAINEYLPNKEEETEHAKLV